MTPVLLHDLLDLRAAATPDAPAMVRHGHTSTFADLAARSRADAAWLARSGIGRGDRFLIVGANEGRIPALVYAASRIGAVFVLVSDQVSEFHLRHIAADSGARLAIGNDTAWPVLQRLPGLTAVPMADLPADADTIGNGEGAVLSVDPICFIYTSGSTALPKAVVSTHRHVLFAAQAIASRLGYRADDTVFCCLPLSFDYGLYQVFLSTIGGSRLVLGDESDAGPALLGRLIEHEVTVLPLVPSLAVTLCRLIGRSDRRPVRLRMVTNTGADLSATQCARLRQAIPGLAVVAMFGLTECKRVSIAEPDLDLTRPGSVGKPLPDTEVYIVGDDGRRLPPDEAGELVVRGPHVMAGYWNAPEITARRYRPDPYGVVELHTGDRARLDADGYLYFLGRDDDVFKQHGIRVSTIEIEAAALTIPGVEMAAALPARDGHEARLAVCGPVDLNAFTAMLRELLGPQKMPPCVRPVARMPLGVNGKVDKRGLAEQWDALTAAPPADSLVDSAMSS